MVLVMIDLNKKKYSDITFAVDMVFDMTFAVDWT